MLVDAVAPQLFPGLGVDGVEIGALIAEVSDMPAGLLAGADDDRSAHAAAGFVLPMQTTGFRVQRIDGAGVAAHVDASAGNRGVASGLRSAAETDGPLQLKPRNVRGRKAGELSGLKTGIPGIGAPTDPARPGERVGERDGLAGKRIRIRRGRRRFGARNIGGHRGQGRRRQPAPHETHVARPQRLHDRLWRESAQGFEFGRAPLAAIVAARARRPVDSRAVGRGRLKRRRQDHPQRDGDRHPAMSMPYMHCRRRERHSPDSLPQWMS